MGTDSHVLGRYIMKKFLASCAFALALAGSANASVVIGTADAGASSSLPFDTASFGSHFAQIYNKAKFGGALTINSLSFYQTKTSGGSVATGNFTIWLGTSDAAISTFDNSAFPYPDSSFTQVYSGKLSAVTNGRLDIELSTLFTYAATKNLVMVVRNDDYSGNGDLFLDVDANAVDVNSTFSAYPYNWNQGLVTGFNAVPEASTWAMMIVGMGLVGSAMRRRKTAVSFA